MAYTIIDIRTIIDQALYDAVYILFEKKCAPDTKRANLQIVALELYNDETVAQFARETDCFNSMGNCLYELAHSRDIGSYKTYVTWEEMLNSLESKGLRLLRAPELEDDPVETTIQNLNQDYESYREKLKEVLGGESGFSIASPPKAGSFAPADDDDFYTRIQKRKEEARKTLEDLPSQMENLMKRLDDRMNPSDPKLAPLSPELRAEVAEALSGPPGAVVVDAFNVQMLRQKLRSLLPRQWLLDEPINFWFELLQERDKRRCAAQAGRRRHFYMNSFFVAKLFMDSQQYNYAGVRRWTKRKKIDVFSGDRVFVPVNVGNMHWCLAVIHVTQKRIQYYDSMGGAGTQILQNLRRWLQDEAKDKKGETLDPSEWELVPTQLDTPQQQNGYDCGVFACTAADYLSEGDSLLYSQEDMPHLRERMVLAIARASLEDPPAATGGGGGGGSTGGGRGGGDRAAGGGTLLL